MRFLVDRCAGKTIADWLRSVGHDVVESRERGPDPGDSVLLEWAADEARVLVTIDTDFGQLVFLDRRPHAGLVRLPDVPATQRVLIMEDILARFEAELEQGMIITVQSGRVRISKSPLSGPKR
jgi:predicted nuclease of predicted toxin-antitoxin system